jgi:hypothetical protein
MTLWAATGGGGVIGTAARAAGGGSGVGVRWPLRGVLSPPQEAISRAAAEASRRIEKSRRIMGGNHPRELRFRKAEVMRPWEKGGSGIIPVRNPFVDGFEELAGLVEAVQKGSAKKSGRIR